MRSDLIRDASLRGASWPQAARQHPEKTSQSPSRLRSLPPIIMERWRVLSEMKEFAETFRKTCSTGIPPKQTSCDLTPCSSYKLFEVLSAPLTSTK
jgi:hypothetical protein